MDGLVAFQRTAVLVVRRLPKEILPAFGAQPFEDADGVRTGQRQLPGVHSQQCVEKKQALRPVGCPQWIAEFVAVEWIFGDLHKEGDLLGHVIANFALQPSAVDQLLFGRVRRAMVCGRLFDVMFDPVGDFVERQGTRARLLEREENPEAERRMRRRDDLRSRAGDAFA